MPRKRRFFIPGEAVHIVQRGRSRDPVFFDTSDYRAYLHWLKEAADRYACAIHAFVLMTNHVHILATPDTQNGISEMMQHVGRSYVPYLNYTYGMSGSIWEGRYKASLVQEGHYLLSCMRYIEMNPVKAGMVQHPGEYPWSSYHHNAGQKNISLLSPHRTYEGIGRSTEERRNEYRALFSAHIDDRFAKEIQCALQTGTPLGNEYFREKVSEKLNCRIGQSKRGAPFKGVRSL